MATQVLLERSVELAELGRAMRSARAGRGGLIVLTGAAGSGKTALLDEAARRWRTRRLHASCSELERDLGFGTARQLLEPAIRTVAPSRRRVLFDGVPDGARQLLTGAGAGTYDNAEVTAGLFRILVRLSDAEPLLLCVDDAQWADAPSLRWLHYVQARPSDLPLVVLITVRADARPELPDDMSFPGAPRLRLRPLGDDSIAHLARVRLQIDVDGEFVRACAHATAGNPLYLQALFAEVIARGTAPDCADLESIGSGAVASSVRRRLAALSPGATRYAEALAVLETRQWPDVVREMAGLSVDDALRSWAALADSGLLTDRTGSGYVHPIVLSSVRDSLAPSRRMALHATAAHALRAAGAPVEVVALHLLRAAPGAVDNAGTALIEAGHAAAAIGAPESAATYLERALEERLDRRLRRAALLRLGQARFLIGSPHARTNLEQAVQLSTSDTERAESVVSLANVLYALGETRSAVDVLLDESERLAAGSVRDHVVESVVQMIDLDLALRPDTVGRLRLGQPRSPVEHMHRAVELAIAGVDRPAAIEHLHTAMQTGELLETRPQYSALAAFVCMICGEYELARTTSHRLHELSVRRGASAEAAMARAVGGYALARAGRLTEAHQQLLGAWAAVRDSGLDVYVSVIADALAECAYRMGRVEEAAATLDQAPPSVPIRTV